MPEPLVRQVRADRPGDLDPVRRGRGAGVAGALRPLGAQRRAPAPAGRSGDHARPVPPQHVPRHARDVRQRRALPGPGEARPARRRPGAPAPDRAGLPLPGADPLRGAGGPAPVHGGVEPGNGGPGAGRSAERLSRDLPPPCRGDHALRPVPSPQQDTAPGEHPGGGGLSSKTTSSASTCRWSGSRTARSPSPARSGSAPSSCSTTSTRPCCRVPGRLCKALSSTRTPVRMPSSPGRRSS